MSKIPPKFYFLLILIAVTHTEIMAGTTDLVHFITQPVLAWSNILFYGLSLILYVDLTQRFKLDLVEVFILGLIHGVIEEGIALWTFFFARPNLSSTMWLGINLNWAILVSVGEAFLLPILGVLFAQIVLPIKENQYLLSKRGYAVSGTVLILLIGWYNLIVAGFHKQVPQVLPYLVTWLTVFFLVGSLLWYHQIRQKLRDRVVAQTKPRSKKLYFLLTFLLFLSYALTGFFLDKSLPVLTTLLIPILLIAPIFLLLNLTIWIDSRYDQTKQAVIFITLLVLFTLSLTAQRSLQNTLFLFVLVAGEISAVIRQVRRVQVDLIKGDSSRGVLPQSIS